MWEAASPAQWQAARFMVADRAMRRVGVRLTPDEIAEARALIDPVVAYADYAGRPLAALAAANVSVALPRIRSSRCGSRSRLCERWRGDAHFGVLAGSQLGPCDCNVMLTATGRLPTGLVRSTRQWNDDEWAAAMARLVRRGWLNVDGSVTEAGIAAREQIEVETDERCAALWAPVGEGGARRLAKLITPVNDAFAAAGT